MKIIKKAFAKFITWMLKDEHIEVGSFGVNHSNTMYTDSIVEKTTNAGVQISRMRSNSGTEAPDQFPTSPVIGQIFYATDTKKIYVYIGDMGTNGCNAKGWFNLRYAHYSA